MRKSHQTTSSMIMVQFHCPEFVVAQHYPNGTRLTYGLLKTYRELSRCAARTPTN